MNSASALARAAGRDAAVLLLALEAAAQFVAEFLGRLTRQRVAHRRWCRPYLAEF